MTTPTRVQAPDGVGLAVYESGRPGGDPSTPTVVAVHGYPDNHAVWDGVVAQLADRAHLVTYDVRGCGASDKPRDRAAYRIDRLVGDLGAVLDAVSPDSPVHLLAHDWGSIQTWPALVDDRLAGRVASFTSISGPSLDYSAVWLRQVRRHPRASLRQLAHSYYIGLFQLPVLPEAAIRRGLLDRVLAHTERADGTGEQGGAGYRTEADQLNGLQLYRANMASRLRAPRPVATDVPVQVIVPEGDAFVTAQLAVEAARPWVADLQVRPVAGGHWIVTRQPDVVAGLTAAFVDGHHPAAPHPTSRQS